MPLPNDCAADRRTSSSEQQSPIIPFCLGDNISVAAVRVGGILVYFVSDQLSDREVITMLEQLSR